MAFQVTKTYGHELGLSACFRQHRAESHCRFLHGYALGFKFVFEADTLDGNNWVIDFGSLKPLKQWLVDTFDHKLLVAQDDPHGVVLASLAGLQYTGQEAPPVALADVLVVERVGCEAFAAMAFDAALHLLPDLATPVHKAHAAGTGGVVRLVEVECREHAGNAASYKAEY
jgi:6-pyruvoyltetrahydropterin/6-carboxytetrahydropterin synthase